MFFNFFKKSIKKTETKNFKYSGRINPNDLKHRYKEHTEDEDLIAPTYVYIPELDKSIPQYAPTVEGDPIGYNPSEDCNGHFMSSKFMPNNNCYAYSTLLATNSFPQPGRKSGYDLPHPCTGEEVVHGAELDGLINIGPGIEHIKKHQQESNEEGHYVALLICPPDDDYGYNGDYHWVRCDDNVSFNKWSQKDGGDQITNFDFEGKVISDPRAANWSVNQGRISSRNDNELITTYEFCTFMFVPKGKVDII